MTEFNTNRIIAYLTLLSGLTLSIVAEYYSIVGLTSIFSAAVIPVVIMGIAIGISKITGTLWLKQNWNIAPLGIRVYLSIAVIILMLITSIGIFGFLSKAHSDQTLVSSDVLSKIAIYDEKIKTEQENIDANRKALKQMDEAVDQIMGRSTTETGADKAVAVRRSQQKERIRLQTEIAASQQTISNLKEARAPIAAEVRKVEAEVGPIKYIAAFFYGSTDPTILEKAVTWVIIILIAVFDPLAVILLLASQISFQHLRKQEEELDKIEYGEWPVDRDYPPEVVAQEVTPVSPETVITEDANIDQTTVSTSTYESFDFSKHPYLFTVPKYRHPPGIDPVAPIAAPTENYVPIPPAETDSGLFVQNEEQQESNLWSRTISQDDYMNISQDKLEEQIDTYVKLIKEKRISMSDVPETLLLAVRAKV